jgi:hypothetical protein
MREFFTLSRAHVAELADAYGSGPYGATRGGSSPLVSMILCRVCPLVGNHEKVWAPVDETSWLFREES